MKEGILFSWSGSLFTTYKWAFTIHKWTFTDPKCVSTTYRWALFRIRHLFPYRHFRVRMVNVIRQRICFTSSQVVSHKVRRRRTMIDTQFYPMVLIRTVSGLINGNTVLFALLQDCMNTRFVWAQDSRYNNEDITQRIKISILKNTIFGSVRLRVPMKRTIYQRVKRIRRRINGTFQLFRVNKIFNRAMARNGTMRPPNLSTTPRKIIQISLIYALRTSFAYFQIMIRCIVEKMIQARVVLRYDINVIRNRVPMGKVTHRLHNARRRFRIRRVISSSQVFPSITIIIPQTSTFRLQTMTNGRDLNALRRRVLMETFAHRFVHLSGTIMRRGTRIIHTLIPLNFFGEPNPQSNDPTPVIVVHVNVCLPRQTKRRAQTPVIKVCRDRQAIFVSTTQRSTAPNDVLLLFLYFINTLRNGFRLFTNGNVNIVRFKKLRVRRIRTIFPLGSSINFK